MSKSIEAQLKKLFKELHADRKEIEKELSTIVKGNAFKGNEMASLKAPKAFGQLTGSIGVVKVDPLHYKVVANADYAPYVEFGTGGKVDVPREWKEMALKLKNQNTGSFEEGLKSFGDWARLKGIPEEDVKFVFFSVLKNGIRPQPFMYPAWKRTKLEFELDIRKYVSSQSR